MIQTLQKNITWRAVPIAGLAAGTVFLVVNMLLAALLLNINPTLLLRYFASLVLGDGALLEATFANAVIGLLVHYALSILFAFVIAIVVHRWGLLVGLVGGGILGLAIYLINLYTVTLVFPWFFAINSLPLAISHVLYGIVVGGVYEYFDHFDMPFGGERTHETA